MKKRIIELKAELQRVKDKQWKKAQLNLLQETIEKKERELFLSNTKFVNFELENERVKNENARLLTENKQL